MYCIIAAISNFFALPTRSEHPIFNWSVVLINPLNIGLIALLSAAPVGRCLTLVRRLPSDAPCIGVENDLKIRELTASSTILPRASSKCQTNNKSYSKKNIVAHPLTKTCTDGTYCGLATNGKMFLSGTVL